MTMQMLTPTERFQNALQNLQLILQDYSIEFLIEKRREFRRNSGSEESKRYSYLYRRAMRYKKIINDYTRSITLIDQQAVVNNNHPSDTCDNCKRQLHKNNDISDIYVLNLSLQDGKNIRSRKFKDTEAFQRNHCI